MSKKGIMYAISNRALRNLALVCAVAFTCGYGTRIRLGIHRRSVPMRKTRLLRNLSAAANRPPTGQTRMEKDLLGEKAVPADAYYGVQTARALENFQISGIPINHYPGFVEAWAIVKLAAAQRQHRCRRHETGNTCGHREGRRGGARTASTTTSSWSTGTRAAPARRRT